MIDSAFLCILLDAARGIRDHEQANSSLEFRREIPADMLRSLVDQHPELRQAPERGERAPFGRLIGKADARETLEDVHDSQLRLEPR